MLSWIRNRQIVHRLLVVKLVLTVVIFAFYSISVDAKSVYVRGYVRKNGTYVAPHYRTAPDGNPYNNYSYPGNYNPNTGQITPGDPQNYLDRYDSNKSSSGSSSTDFDKWLENYRKELDTQLKALENELGTSQYQTPGRVKVQGYYRQDGTYVAPHYRTAPDGNPYNNYSYPGNYNPNTGTITPGDPVKYLERDDSNQSNQPDENLHAILHEKDARIADLQKQVEGLRDQLTHRDKQIESLRQQQKLSQQRKNSKQILKSPDEGLKGISGKNAESSFGKNLNKEVVATQGGPDSLSECVFEYGFSTVNFSKGRVTNWNNDSLNPLKAKLVPAPNTQNKGDFTVGSTKDEVLAVQGPPDNVIEYSSANFSKDRVTSWDNSKLNPLKAR